ncbi:MAG: class I SAM-dependent methyltransferase [Gemmatimonadetes bacterium]|nr:class I SAM-dependent methyltransferase [Gemmatimonadota bacterium]
MTRPWLRPLAAVIRRFPHLLLPLRRAFERFFSPPQGADGIRKVGHRRYVGGRWDVLGREQLEFLKSRGLEPRHVLLDIACGSLRLGRHAIPFLEPGHYLGIEKEQELIDAGIRYELEPGVLESRRPELLASADFEFDRLSRAPDFAIANSLFSHLPPPLIRLCLARLRPFIRPDGVFYATFFEADRPARNPEQPHDHHMFVYTRDEMRSFGAANGWKFEYIGDWGHARGQVMAAYRPAP